MARVSQSTISPISPRLCQFFLVSSSSNRFAKLVPSVVKDERPLPPPAASTEEDDAQFADDGEVSPPIFFDFGTNVKLGKRVYINVNCTIIDTCLVTIGARTLFAPNVSIYSGTHPTNPELRDGMNGPESGKEVHIGEDVWIGGHVVILPGVRVGKGATLGAGCVVTKVFPPYESPRSIFTKTPLIIFQDVPDYTIVVGNPARILRRVDGHENDEIPLVPTIPSLDTYQ